MISRRRLLYSMAATVWLQRQLLCASPHGPLLAALPATRHILALLTTNQVQHPSGCGATGTSPCDPDHQSYIIFAIREGI
jgi:hypothetical protein